ncbi:MULTISPECIES: MFS transporter [unclassified Peribacillus]|uniref:MFS transporter n=1 Tax=unclassified Peribacillus TaxID=2675266 RepID=UPI001F4DD1D3|nr:MULTISPECIES: MFS transporter [unclassified Peribacillus]MCK1986465.1 MFS transporter [Peribacillus sp. Aquil_B1]MCK2011485.1 MFS transporter [Peribacillus sp. Aquil_B8]
MKNPFIKMATGLYISYFILGMINIIIGSNMENLSEQLNTSASGISYLVSAIGIGKLVSLFFAGRLSDKLGRKPFVVSASFIYLIFLIGIPLAPSYTLAFIFAICAGIANSFLDAGTYPALIEAFQKKAGSATVLVKAFVSIGAALLPFIMAFFIARDMFYGYTFFLMAAVYLVNGFFLLKVSFPDHKAQGQTQNDEQAVPVQQQFLSKPKFAQEGLAVILLGFTSTALFMLVQVWLPNFGQDVLGLTQAKAVQLLSYYSIGSLVSVILLAVLLNKVIKPITVMIIYPVIAALSLLSLIYIQQPFITVLSAFFIGLSTAGVFQLAMTIITEFFPANKGTITSYVNIAASSAFIIIPFVTGIISKSAGLTAVFLFDVAIAIVSILLAVFVAYRYKKVIKISN